jgi:hypothetical protein
MELLHRLSVSKLFPRRVVAKTKAKNKSAKKVIHFTIEKRQKFILSVTLLSILLFITEFQFGKSGLFIGIMLSVLTDMCLFWAIREDLNETNGFVVFILPFFYSLAFGSFYFLIPGRIIFRLLLTLLYAFGLYSLFLSQNIFVVSSIRTIQLLSGARIVSFVITLLSYFFFSNIVYSLHIFVLYEVLLVAIYTYLLSFHSIWTYSLQKTAYSTPLWVLGMTTCLAEIGTAVWFWPTSPTIISIFLTGIFYVIAGLSHVWLEKRLFRNVLWEYTWVCVIVFFMLIIFTQWGK